MIQRVDVVRDFLYVLQRNSWSLFVFKEQKIGQGRLRAFNLRGKHRFLSDISVDKEAQVRQHRGEPVEPAERLVGTFQKPLQTVKSNRRNRGERGWNESADGLAAEV